MNIAKLSIKRPIFMGCLVILLMVIGFISLKRLGVDIFPPIDFPVVTVMTTYPGTSPEEIEKLITKPIEEQVSTIAGIKRLSSRNLEGVSIVIAEFTFESDVKFAVQNVREKVALVRNKLPEDLDNDPVVRQFDFTDVPVITIAYVSDLPPAQMYDVVSDKIKPIFEQVEGVGEVRISGGTKREIRVELDRNKLNEHQISALTVVDRIGNSGVNVPVGRYEDANKLTVFRTIGEFKTLDQLRNTVVQFSGDSNNPTTLNRIGEVRDGTEDATTKAYLYFPVDEPGASKGDKKTKKNNKDIKRETRSCLILDVFKQSGANTVVVADGIMKKMNSVNSIVEKNEGNSKLVFVYDMAKFIRNNIDDVKETMIIGILLAILVVYLFLGNIRSTIITGIAIPNSILGAFILMYFMGFTINIMSLLALSLTVGLLVDDAIVVRENIFRKIEHGLKPMEAAEKGTMEVMLAVIATSLTIIAVFLPIGFLEGIIGRFFKQFGLTVVFAMVISLFDALTIAPLLSAYFAGTRGKATNFVVTAFDGFQGWLEKKYKVAIKFSLDHPIIIIAVTSVILFGSLVACGSVKKTFQPDPDEGEYQLNIEVDPGTSLDGTDAVTKKIAERIKTIPELDYMTIQVGTGQAGYNKATFGIFMVPAKERKRTTAELKEVLREMMKEFAYAKPSVDNYTRSGGGGGSNKPFILSIKGEDLDLLNRYSTSLIEKLKTIKDLTEIKTSMEQGVPELQIRMDERRMLMAGVNNKTAGTELRYLVEGAVAGKYRDKGLEYDIRVRLKPDQRDLRAGFNETRVPNMQNRQIPLAAISNAKMDTGPSVILRQDRARTVQVSANLAKGGAIGSALDRTKEIIEKELPLPDGVSYSFIGQADSYQDMIKNIIVAFVLSLIFIYLVLSSLYESFITPFTILVALPPALSGAIFALFITGKMLDMFSMIGIIMLLGLVTKNSILMVDFALQGVRSGMSRKEAITQAGVVRLRPILMTTFAMLAGTLPVAIGAGEAAKYRTGMGVAIMGGLIISTLITLVVVPAVFEYIDIFREKIESRFRPEQ
ncbi:MAG TPA: efflux RND transporter permease subunit [Spirochaetota bacterium]|nr:efflux RND transporter permease subunit [Spirochaetota bacterium]HPS86130.1 efflux RND transporter permease subunit [Spirochaetota bacterium]